ncbi:uncharacterized protein LOC135809633 [Sycon ciliatum]|uniref:uncharacterized protein LOC135809633 n=1 Tax=Sycon ciliatum TaxID=27933 RepID=UPI0020ACB706|eukprot:scpid50062/ scgid27940/ 
MTSQLAMIPLSLLAACLLLTSCYARPSRLRRDHPSGVRRRSSDDDLFSQQRTANDLEASETGNAPWTCTLRSRQYYFSITPSKTVINVEQAECHQHEGLYVPVNDTTTGPTGPSLAWTDSKFITCHGDEVCLPAGVTNEDYRTVLGLRKTRRAHRCKCFSVREPCRPVKHIEIFFPNTPFRTWVDTKRCVGSCPSLGRRGLISQSCRPTRTRTITIPGPNGAHCVNITQECGCALSCYRTSYDMIFIEQQTDAITGQKTFRNRTIDVGICQGSCAQRVREECAENEPNGNGTAIDPGLKNLLTDVCVGKVKNLTECVPNIVETVRFNSTKGEIEVPIIKDCTCVPHDLL